MDETDNRKKKTFIARGCKSTEQRIKLAEVKIHVVHCRSKRKTNKALDTGIFEGFVKYISLFKKI